MSRVAAIAAIGRNRELGKGNELLWHIPDDLKRFKRLTLEHPVIMGRKTFESIIAAIGKPLPGRTNIVVTRDLQKIVDIIPQQSHSTSQGVALKNDGHTKPVIVASSVEDAIQRARQAPGSEEIFIGGGGQIYAEALPYVDKLYLTLIDDEKEADSFFPPYEGQFTNIISDEVREHEGLKYRWVDVER